MKIPPVNLTAEYREIKSDLNSRLNKIFSTAQFILGDEVRECESRFAKLIGTKFAIGVNSGTDALYLSLIALGIGKGDEVITTPMTYIATGMAIARTGAKPVFVDIDPETFDINPDLIPKAITERTKAIMPVHLYGTPCDMTKIMAIAKKHKLRVIEDCAQSTGAKWRGKTTGSFGDCGAFSFYPTKIVGAYGDGGMITTNQPKLAEVLRSLRAQSDPHKKYIHDRIGFNSRLDSVQAAVINAKLNHFARWNKQRERAAKFYDHQLSKIPGIKILKRINGRQDVIHQYGILVSDRDRILNELKQQGIAVGIYYPIPLHLQPCFKYLRYKRGDFPEAERIISHVLNLPIFPQITFEQQRFTVSKVKEFYS